MRTSDRHRRRAGARGVLQVFPRQTGDGRGPPGAAGGAGSGLFPEGYGAKEFFADVKLQFTANLPAMDDLVENRDPAAAERRRRRAYGDKDLDEEMAFASLLASPGFAKGGAAAVGAFLFLYVFIIGPPPS